MNLASVIDILNHEIRLKDQETWDNSGLQLGSMEVYINKVMLTMDLGMEALDLAIKEKVNLIITHHPLFFSPIKRIDTDTYDGQIIKMLINENINVYSIHTSYDMADKGVTHSLAEKLNITGFRVLHPVNADGSGYGGVGEITPVNIIEYAKFVKKTLETDFLRLFSKGDEIVKRVAFCGGSGGEFIEDAIRQEAQVYITGDIKYHQAQEALKNNLCIIDAGHYNTEIHSLENIREALVKRGLDVISFKKNITEEKII